MSRDNPDYKKLVTYLRLLRRSYVSCNNIDDRKIIENRVKLLLSDEEIAEAFNKTTSECLGTSIDNISETIPNIRYKTNNQKSSNKLVYKRERDKKVVVLAAGLSIGVSSLLVATDSYAAAFNLATAGRAVFDPVIALVTEHFGKGVVAVGGVGALVAPGDLRTKAIGFAIGAAASGLAMLAVKAGFGI